MFRDILSGSRALVVGLVFFVVVVGGSLLYSWRVDRSSQEELEQTKQAVQQLGDRAFTRAAQDNDVPVEVKPLGEAETSTVSNDAKMVSGETEALSINNAGIVSDESDIFFEETVEVGAETEESPYGVSPHGFGPFPAVPPDYFRTPEEVWGEERLRTMLREHELLSRVQIELWNQGIRTFGAKFENGLVYPARDDVVYIEWADSVAADGKMYVVRQFGSPAIIDQYGDDISEGIFPAHLQVYEFPDGGIDPYEFLGLPR
jgi:hypothetical protein